MSCGQSIASGSEISENGRTMLALQSDLFADLKAVASASNGFVHDMTHHVIGYLPSGNSRLVVTFDNLASRKAEGPRLPWGHGFLSAQGWDVMGILVKRPDWFRDPELWDAFDRLRDDGFFARYAHVAMYGSSMGAYGALAFAPAAPGCTVLAFAPQSTLERTAVPFETRYRYGRNLGPWSGRYVDGADGVRAAGRAYIAFDPRERLDAAHAARMTGQNITFLRMPGVGHKIPPALQQMGILKPVVLAALAGELEPPVFNSLFRARRKSLAWTSDLLDRAAKAGHVRLAIAAAERLLTEDPRWKIRQQLNSMREAAKSA